jgi:hypothetical protein
VGVTQKINKKREKKVISPPIWLVLELVIILYSLQREFEEGKLNAVSLFMIHSSGVFTEEEPTKEMKSIIGSKRRELLKLVLLLAGKGQHSSKSMQGFVLENDQSMHVAPIFT